MLHAALHVLYLAAVMYATVDIARKPRWRPWLLGYWSARTLISFAWADTQWLTVFAAANLALAHFAPLVDQALARWADRLWDELNRR